MWKARNSWLYNGQMVTELEVVQQAMEECLEFAECQQKSGHAAQRKMMVDRQKAWQHPEAGCVKLNVSSVWEGVGKTVGVGIIARNHNGKVEQPWSVAREEVANPVVAETNAVRVALVVAQQNGRRNVEIEVDIKALSVCLQTRKIPVLEASR